MDPQELHQIVVILSFITMFAAIAMFALIAFKDQRPIVTYYDDGNYISDDDEEYDAYDDDFYGNVYISNRR